MKTLAAAVVLTATLLTAGHAVAQYVPAPPPRPTFCTTVCSPGVCTTYCS